MYEAEIEALRNQDITFQDMVDLILDCYPEPVAFAAARCHTTEELILVLQEF